MFDPTYSVFDLVPAVISACVLCFALDLWRRTVDAAPRHGRAAGAVLAAWAGSAVLATHVPALGRMIGTVPGLLPVLLIAAIAAPVLAASPADGRRAFDRIPIEDLMTFFYWRAVFGALLLATTAAGRLPAEFGIHAGLGDIAVTMLMVLVLALRSVSDRMARGAVLLWNAIGLLDLVNVLVGAALVARPWIEQRGLSGQFALQLFGVPIFIALHLLIFGRLWRERRTASHAPAF